MLNRNLILITLVVFCAGCGYQLRTYVMTKDRVGLDRGNGNGGCIEGTCPPPAPPAETTRKVYVLEVTKPVPESEVRKIEETAINAIVEEPAPSGDDNTAPSAPAAAVDNTQAAAPAPAAVQVPVVGELPGSIASDNSQATTTAPAAEGNGGNLQTTVAGSTYTVQKDDTLQKISKKLFGTYSKWYKIYQANKDKISNPNVLKPGTVLTIPNLK